MNSIITVTTPADSFELTVLGTVKGELGITTTSYDDRLATWIVQASGIVTTACNRVLASESVTETFRPRSRVSSQSEIRPVTLSRYPVTDIASVVENGVTLTTDDYEYNAETGELWRLSGGERTDWLNATIVVAYTGGYELLGALPYPLERATILLVKQLYHSATRDPMIKRREVPGVLTTDYWVGSVTSVASLPPDVEALIAPYRNRALG